MVRQLAPSVYHQVVLYLPQNTLLLPSLLHLTLRVTSPSDIPHALPFLNSNIKHIDLSIRNTIPEAASYLFSEMKARVPKVQHLALSCDMAMATFEESLLAYITRLRSSLKEIVLDRYCLTSGMSLRLAQTPSIEKISTHYSNRAAAQQNGSTGMWISHQPNGWSRLKKVALASNLGFTSAVSLGVGHPRLVQELQLTIPISPFNFHSESELRCALVNISRTYVVLESLFLDLLGPTSVQDSISFDTLEPLGACRSLKKLFIRHRNPVQLNSSQLDQLLHFWPGLRAINICVDPVHTNQSARGLPIRVLAIFARHCPKIEHIGLQFDDSVPSSVWNLDLRLDSLKTLHVGWSGVGDVMEVASYLAELCNTRMEIKFGDSAIIPYSNQRAKEVEKEGRWQEVGRMFRAFARARERIIAQLQDRDKGIRWWQIRKTPVEDVVEGSKEEEMEDQSWASSLSDQ